MKNNFTEINEGGLHEENKLGGVPMGVGQNGQLNTVEENETINDKFVYSNRITLTPQVIAQFNLPKSLSGKTAADATKLINNKFEGRNSKIDNNTKKAFLDRIAEAQETVKAEEQAKIQESMQINSTEVPDMMEGQIPQGMEEFTQPQQQMFNGGELSQGLSMLGTSGAFGQHTGINQATTALDLGNTAFGKTGIDTSGATDVDPGSVKPGMIGVTGALKGAQAGAMFGPIGTGVGAAIGLGAGLIGGFKAKKDALKAHQNFEIGQSNQKISNFAYGGKMYNDGGYLDKFKSSTMYDDPNYVSTGHDGLFKNSIPMVNSKVPKKGQFYKQLFDQLGKPQISNDLGYTSKLNYNDPDTVNLSPEQLQENNGYSNPENTPSRMFGPQATGHYEGEMYDGSKVGKIASKVGQYAKDNYGNALRYAPVAMNAYQLAKMGKPEVETLDRLGNRYNPQYMDEKALTNQINAETNYTANALANASNGSLGSLSNNILGMQLNKTKALSDAYSKVADVNRNEDKTGQQFNLGVDQFNVGQSNQEKDINARNRGAFKTERSKLLGQIGDDLGNIGKEQVYKKLAGKAFGYSYDGEYLLKPDGTKVSEEELDSTIKTNLSSVGATEKEGKYFDTTGKEISKEEVLKMIGTQKTFNKNYQGKFSSMNTNFGNISLTNNNKQ